MYRDYLCRLAAKDKGARWTTLENFDSYTMFVLAVYMYNLGWDCSDDGFLRALPDSSGDQALPDANDHQAFKTMTMISSQLADLHEATDEVLAKLKGSHHLTAVLSKRPYTD